MTAQSQISEVTMPQLSEGADESTLLEWLVADGDQVEVGQELAELETDKATVSLQASDSGIIRLVAAPGETVALGAVLAYVSDDGRLPANDSPVPAETPGENAPATADTAQGAEPSFETTAVSESRTGQERLIASPIARRLAAHMQVNLAEVVGTGRGGRILRIDVQRASRSGTENESLPATAEPSLTAGSATLVGPDLVETDASQIIELTSTQRLIARRMSQSRATIADFDLSVEVDMESAWALREELKADADRDVIPSLNDLVVLASAKALKRFPNVNSTYRDGNIEQYARIDIGIAVAAGDALVVPVIRDASRRSLGDIARTARDLAGKVREGRATPAELSGATFTVSNLGMYGVDSFTAVINSPQTAILAVGTVKQRAVVHEGTVVARRSAVLTLAADHRVVYGAYAAGFLMAVKTGLETPIELLVG